MKKVSVYLAAVIVLCAGVCFASGVQDVVMASDGRVVIHRAAALPQYGWQKRAVFPDWKGYTDDTLAMNSMLSFLGCPDQGEIWIDVAPEVESFSLFVNGVRADTGDVGPGTWVADIAGAAQNGVNTLQLSNTRPLGLTGAVSVYIPYPVVIPGDGALGGIRPEALRLIGDIISSDIRYGFTGAQLAVIRDGRLVVNNAWGKVNSYQKDGAPDTVSQPVTTQTLYDLASLTKMFSVNYAVQKLLTDGLIDLDAPVTAFLGDDFASDTLDVRYYDAPAGATHARQLEWKRALTVRDLLSHRAGFPSSVHYYLEDYDLSLRTAIPGAVNPCYARDRTETLAALKKTPLLYEPRTRTLYSDIDYMVLTFIVEAVTGQRLDRYMQSVFYEPMGLDNTTFLPLENGFLPDDCAATELNGNTRDGRFSFPGVRTGTLMGQPHDEKAWYCMEGVSGHAGLFSSAEDLARLAFVMLTGGYGENRFFSRNVMDFFTAPGSPVLGQWGLGWWRQGDDQRPWYYGTMASPSTVGHQGWTGTLAVIDPTRQLVIVYLTNAVNSPVVASDLSFSGGAFTASTLGFVPQILSIGMDGDADVTDQLNDLVLDMACESLRLIKADTPSDHPLIKNARSKIDVLRAWTGDDAAADRLLALLPD